MTKAGGGYVFEIDSEEPTLTLIFSKLGYESEKATVETITQRLDMTMSKTAVALPEMTVSNPEVRLRGDTLSFLLAAFAGKGDVSLKDALRKVPGVEVSASGEISYNGKKISNFYIEGMDLMGGKYDLATSNIPASYVNAIEILNNHKDRKIDRNLFSDNVALNVRLKPKAKFRPTGTYGLSAGTVGDPLLLAASGAGMLFRESFQSMLTLKGSDIREFSAREHNRFLNQGESEAGSYATDILGHLSASSPPLSRGRWIRPIDASATANFINKTGKDATLRGDLGYSFQTHDIGLSFFPLEGFELKLSSSVIRKEIEQGRHQTVPLFDMKGVYSFRKFRLTCELRNLLNRRSYSYTLFTGLDRFTYDYRLRRRELILSVDFKM